VGAANGSRAAAWARRHRRALALTGAAVALCLTVVWLVVVPGKAESTTGLQEAAIRWGHPASWALLALLGALVAADAPERARSAVGLAAAACYAAFLAGLLL
jgi:hypothetical protein